jgi:tRNA U34 5-methylaminomethyl-2-thiouridine-forming methyltransferase MnmC
LWEETSEISTALGFTKPSFYIRIAMGISIYRTADQSHTLYNEELDETYHSRNGAVEESRYVFLKQGFELKAALQHVLNILEVGFGTGLNALLTLTEAEESRTRCAYHSLETFPLPAEVVQTLNHTEFIEASHHDKFELIHRAAWNEPTAIAPYFTLQKISESIHTYQPQTGFDLVYFDAFGPDKQPDMWTQSVFDKLYTWMNAGAVLVTYSSKGDVRRALAQAGFQVERLPGPPRKRHMLRATKP